MVALRVVSSSSFAIDGFCFDEFVPFIDWPLFQTDKAIEVKERKNAIKAGKDGSDEKSEHKKDQTQKGAVLKIDNIEDENISRDDIKDSFKGENSFRREPKIICASSAVCPAMSRAVHA